MYESSSRYSGIVPFSLTQTHNASNATAVLNFSFSLILKPLSTLACSTQNKFIPQQLNRCLRTGVLPAQYPSWGLCQSLLRSMLGCGWFIYAVGANRSKLSRLDGIHKKLLMKCLDVVVSVPEEAVQVEAKLERLCLRRLIASKQVLQRRMVHIFCSKRSGR